MEDENRNRRLITRNLDRSAARTAPYISANMWRSPSSRSSFVSTPRRAALCHQQFQNSQDIDGSDVTKFLRYAHLTESW